MTLRALSALIVVLATALLAGKASAGDTRVAVAANFTAPAKAIAAAFTRATGHRAVLSFGASGAFYTQIANGAPFDVLLSADAERPAKAEADGLALRGSRFTYAIGRLVLYSTKPRLVDPRGGVLRRGNFARLAIADPLLAPYGQAAMETMRRLKVSAALKPKLVTGTSITQAYQFVATGAADLGFVAKSQVIGKRGGSLWLVPASYHSPITQQAVILKRGDGNRAALAFARFLRTSQAKAIIRRYGYGA